MCQFVEWINFGGNTNEEILTFSIHLMLPIYINYNVYFFPFLAIPFTIETKLNAFVEFVVFREWIGIGETHSQSQRHTMCKIHAAANTKHKRTHTLHGRLKISPATNSHAALYANIIFCDRTFVRKTKWNWNIKSENDDQLVFAVFNFGKCLCFRCLALHACASIWRGMFCTLHILEHITYRNVCVCVGPCSGLTHVIGHDAFTIHSKRECSISHHRYLYRNVKSHMHHTQNA